MTFEEILDQAIAMLQRRGRMTYRTLQRQFALDEEALTDLKDELLYAHPEIRDDAGRGLIWNGTPSSAPPATSPPASPQERTPLSYTPSYLAEKILTSRSALEGERKQVTVLFADLKGSTELIEGLDPEEARKLLDPALHVMMDAVHRYEGTVNQVLGDGIMALFGAPVAHEDHAVRACYAALAMQAAMRRYAEEVRRSHGLERAGAGHGQVAALVGEAGVGKSRLIYEFVHSHYTQGWSALESASVSYGKATPYFPVIDLLRRYGHIEDQDDTHTIRAKLTGQVLTLDEALQDTIPALLSLLDALPEDSPFLKLDPPQRRQRTLDALKRLLLRESQVQPLLLVFEDLHWIDSETQALLNSLVESLPTTCILLLVNYRREYQHSWGSKTYYTQLRLDPLPPVSADEFLQALLGEDASLAPLKHLLIARTEGNPFFLEESVRTLVESGVLVGEPGAYRLAQGLPTVQVPATVQAVLAARIDRLPPEEKRLLQTAAVIGTEVPLPLLQAIAELGMFAAGRALGEEGLQIAEAVTHPASLMVVSYGVGLLALRQGDLYNALSRLERAIGISQDGDHANYFPWVAAALGEAYTLGGRVADAVPLLTQALEQTMVLDLVGHQALCCLPLGETQRLAGRPEEAQALAERALALARAHQERGHQAYALRLLGNIAAQREPPESDQAGEYYRQALALAEELGMRPLLAHCHRGLGTLYLKIERPQQARAELSAAIALYRTMDMTFWWPQAEAALAQIA